MCYNIIERTFNHTEEREFSQVQLYSVCFHCNLPDLACMTQPLKQMPTVDTQPQLFLAGLDQIHTYEVTSLITVIFGEVLDSVGGGRCFLCGKK